MTRPISPREREQLKWLYEELLEAQKRVADAIRTGGLPLSGPALVQLMIEHEKESTIIERIKRICS
jgi:hypothetical protein